MRRVVLLSIAVLMAFVLMAVKPADETHQAVVRATLDNGLRVVIVRDPLAPVVTVEENYLAGGNETPAGFPGMAHAQEHMAFRGCAGVTADQIAAIYAQLGGSGNADTQQNITQYFVTVPAEDLEVALRAGCCLHAGRGGFAGAVGRRARRDRAGGFARSLESHLQIHFAAQSRICSRARPTRTTRWAPRRRSTPPPARCSRSFTGTGTRRTTPSW